MTDYANWIESIEKRLETLEDDKVLARALAKAEKDNRRRWHWAVPVGFTALNTLISLSSLYLNHR